MSVCPVCKYQHYEEVSKCPRCNWSMQDNLDFVEINPEHPILKTCIPTLVESLKAETALKEKLQSIIQQLELQESNSHKLDEILEEIEANKQQSHQEITTLKDKIDKLKIALESKNDNNSDVEVEETNNFTIFEHIPSSLPMENNLIDFDSRNLSNMEDSESNSIFLIESDRDNHNDFNPTNEPLEDSLYSKTDDTQENLPSEVNTNRNYQSFYRLINSGELEVTKVTVPQETMEKMRAGTLSEFKFINDRKGNYWIVNWHNVYCLIPKEKTNISPYQYGNFQRLFECQKYQENYLNFEVIEPAIVLKHDDETWQLERKGKIKFS
ncbi:MAG: hypothetical protein RLZZ535_3046 [Cyanobacteriota bacterium]